MTDIKKTIIGLKKYYETGETLSYHYRIDKLRKLSSALYTYEKKLNEALKKDLGIHSLTSYMNEIDLVNNEIKFYIKNLKSFMKKKRVDTPKSSFLTTSYITNEPLGTVLIISPSNAPLYLSLAPLVVAIAGGNTVLLKPSRSSKNTTSILNKMLISIFSQQYVSVIIDEENIYEELSKYKFDLIFFTGSQKNGKQIMEKAAENLTPVILELGGKSPVYIDSSANLKKTVARLVWGKFYNVGQTGVSPDYVLCHEKVYQKVLLAIKEEIINLYGDNPLFNNEYGKIINKKNFNRLSHLLDDGTLAYGGYLDPDSLKIAPSIIVNPDLNSDLMNEEIFGPILPIIKVKNFNEAIKFIYTKQKPLAAYLFTKNSKQINFFNNNLSFGGGCINDCIVQINNPNLPYGGIGKSGIGSYHGESGYKTFTHDKPIMRKSFLFDLKTRRIPYKKQRNKK